MLSLDAIIFGMGHLNGPRAKLSFGGDGVQMAITPRARAALTELLNAGYAEKIAGEDARPRREHYRGANADPHLGLLLKASGVDPFKMDSWPAFEKST
jgi:hypothetical protein